MNYDLTDDHSTAIGRWFIVETAHLLNLVPVFEHTNFAVVNLDNSPKKPAEKSIFTFVSSNVLLGAEIMGKFQNMDLVYRRAVRMGDALRTLMGKESLNNCAILEDSSAEPEVVED